ncbi:CMGC/CDK/CDK8 protein kinase [Aphanomyces invadans]|uniref:Cyclin-dependent kinase 2 homolog n=1 Tax=Aphanomyces invadans TaxID=157072 RepID=A0A024TEL6_9STRA|nr:CMGC/CDK/CDK8 protein kinase [Aphanomyces invadans]ETV92610.1 CMGC/CDK/CDK8 protein kinase [Aphanomyces invadans]|eukprot:XP_008878647.1 CMGC/CDK/CDK8 protein kinase [Aphanomyces invadans]
MRRQSLLQTRQNLSDKYKLLGKIGEGTYGIVYKAEPLNASSRELNSRERSPEDEEQSFAVKVIKTQKEGKNEVVLSIATVREIKILREMHHDNVVHLHDVHVDPKATSLALVFDYADHDLHDIIKQSRQKPLTEYTKKSFMHQILKGVKYMHDNWVMHRDMKPQNILVVGHGRRRGQVKLADFGLARIYKDPIKALTEVERVVVTLWYRAPELLLGAKHYTKAVDMWAVGCIFAEILNTRELFVGQEVNENNAPFQKDQCDKIFKILGLPTPQTWSGMEHLPEYSNVQNMTKEREYPTTSKLHEAVKFGTGQSSVLLRDLVSRMLYYDPENRITASEALAHDYFKCEPYPRDYAFDEPNKEPIHFQKQKIKPLEDPAKATSPVDGTKDDDDGRARNAHMNLNARPNGAPMKRASVGAEGAPPNRPTQWSSGGQPGSNQSNMAPRSSTSNNLKRPLEQTAPKRPGVPSSTSSASTSAAKPRSPKQPRRR